MSPLDNETSVRLARIYYDGQLVAGRQITLPANASNHVLQVLRLKPGQPLVLFNGDGHDYATRLIQRTGKDAVCEIQQANPVHRESPLNIHLAQALVRGERMDFVLQKATELGVHAITPITTERSQVHLPTDRLAKRLQHWQQIVIAACEQCGRTVIPQVFEPMDLAGFADRVTGVTIALCPGDFQPLDLAPVSTQVSLLVGPEGGFSDGEISLFQYKEFFLATTGPRILRTETAACTGLAILQSSWGDMQ